MAINIRDAIKVFILAIIVWSVVNLWVEGSLVLLFDTWGFQKTATNYFLFGFIGLVITIIILYFVNIEAHTMLGIDEDQIIDQEDRIIDED